jgi:hypothetical protein
MGRRLDFGSHNIELSHFEMTCEDITTITCYQ